MTDMNLCNSRTEKYECCAHGALNQDALGQDVCSHDACASSRGVFNDGRKVQDGCSHEDSGHGCCHHHDHEGMISSREKFADLPIFTGIAEEKIPDALNCLGATVKREKKGVYLFRQGEKIPYLGVLLEGEAYLQSCNEEGERSIYSDLKRGSLIGSIAVFAGDAEAQFDVKTLSDCRILRINPDQFLPEHASSCPFRYAVMQNLLRLVAQENVSLQSRIKATDTKNLRSRISRYLEQQAAASKSRTFTIPFVNRADFADYLGVNTSALSRELGRMRDDGILTFYKNSFRLNA